MKKFIALSLLSAGIAFAQTGLQGGSDGLHQVNANTLGQWNFSFGVGGDFALDSWSLSRKGEFTDENGKKHNFNADDASLSGNVNLGIGLLDFWDIGASMPFYYDHANSDNGTAASDAMWSSGIGDVDVWTKVRVPFDDKFFLGVATFLEMYIPSGTDGAGVRPRHAWYLDDAGATSAYSGEGIALSASLALTLDFMKLGFPLRWNMNGGFLKAFGHDVANTFSYATGFNVMASKTLDFFLEFSGEMRVEDTKYPRDPMVDPMLITPGFRARFGEHVDLTIGIDFAARLFKNFGYEGDEEMSKCENYTVHYRKDGKSASYCYASTPLIAGTAALVWRFGAPKKSVEEPKIITKSEKLAEKKTVDTDGDGVPDSEDKCPYTKMGMRVDSTGCGVDSDGDGIIDENDKCPDTPQGVVVGLSGCPMDTDRDGVLDDADKCPKTPEGVTVDSVGCPTDSDADGVFDGLDKCPNTAAGTRVDSTGCELDFDHDGVPDGVDRCPNTPAGYAVDSVGCVKDDDHDGVADQVDKCPNTKQGITVDSVGCPLDFDKDGVPDQLDQCPNTKQGAEVDSVGCEKDTDQDGVPDGLDKCPDTKKGVPVDSVGCSLDSDGDVVPDYKDQCPGTPKGISVDAKGCPASKKEDLVALGRRFTFKGKSAELAKGSNSAVADVAALMAKATSLNIEIQGYVGGKGNAEKNLKLAQDRAESVKKALIAKGVDEKRLRTTGFSGEDVTKKPGKIERIELVAF